MLILNKTTKIKIKIDDDLLEVYRNGPESLLKIYNYVFSAKGKDAASVKKPDGWKFSAAGWWTRKCTSR